MQRERERERERDREREREKKTLHTDVNTRKIFILQGNVFILNPHRYQDAS